MVWLRRLGRDGQSDLLPLSNEKAHSPRLAMPDGPTADDLLGLEDYARIFATEIATTARDKTPWTVGIHGEWGSGKTSFLKMIDRMLRDRGIEPVWFNAWKYAREENLWTALLQSILARSRVTGSVWRRPIVMLQIWRRGLNLRAGSWEVIRKLALMLLRVAFIALGVLFAVSAITAISNPVSSAIAAAFQAAGVSPTALQSRWIQAVLAVAVFVAAKPDFLFNLFDVNLGIDFSKFSRTRTYKDHVAFLDEFSNEFSEILRIASGDRALVVIIDDLDRCLPEQTLQVIEAMKVFLDVPGCIFLLAVDREIVEQAIATRFGHIVDAEGLSRLGETYFEKIIQLPFLLPPTSRDSAIGFVTGISKDPDIQQCAPILIGIAPYNPRRIKRIIQAFILLRTLAGAHGEAPRVAALAKLVVIQHQYRALYRIVLRQPDILQRLERVVRSTTDPEPDALVEELLAKFPDLVDFFTVEVAANDASFEGADLTHYLYLVQRVLPQTEDTQTTDDPSPVTTPRKPFRVFGAVPNAADGFQDRGLVDQLDVALSLGGVTVTQLLSGLGGVGKTQLAAAAVRRLAERGDLDVVLWVNASVRDAVVATYAQAGAEIAGVDPADPLAAATAFMAYLASTTSRWLIVLDDVAFPQDLDGWWPPASPTGRVLVTSRRRDAALSAHGRVIAVDLFTPAEARAYLEEKFRDAPNRLVGADDLAANLGYLPLALAQAAAFIADRDLTCAQYQERLAAHPLASLAPNAWPDEYARSVAVTLSLAIQAANELAPAGLAKPLMNVLSLLDHNGIPRQITAAEGVAKYLQALQSDTTVDEQAARDALTCLTRLSLADIVSLADGTAQIHVHSLVQRAVRDQIPADQVSSVAAAAADALLQIWPEVERSTALAQLLRANTSALRENAEDALWAPDGHEVLFRSGRSLGEAGLVAAAMSYFDWLATKASERLGPDHPQTLTARNNLAKWRGEAGDAAGAATAFESLLADRARVLGPDHPDTLTARNDLAYWRGEAGDPAGAAAALEAVLTDSERILGPDHPRTLDARNNLAYWRGEAGDPTGAAAAFESLLADRVRVLGPDHPDTLTARNNLALWRGEAGDPAGAAAGFEALLADRLRVLGPDHPDTLTARHNLARWRGRSGDAIGAVAALETLLADSLRVLGPDHPQTLTIRYNLARWRGEAGDTAAAIPELEALLADQIRVLGPDHPHSQNTRRKLDQWRRGAAEQ